MIYVTHDQTEAMTLADKIVVLRDGRVEQVGSPMELYNNPANQFVAGFLGSPAMNFLPAALLREGDDRTVGIRPEDLTIDPKGALSIAVQHVEKLGGDTNVIGQIGDIPMTLRLFGQHEVAQGETLTLGVAEERMLFFSPSGERVVPDLV
jgi:multiple sugar transport system ATP-binding protein